MTKDEINALIDQLNALLDDIVTEMESELDLAPKRKKTNVEKAMARILRVASGRIGALG